MTKARHVIIARVAAEHGHVDYVQSAERAMSALDAGDTIKMPA